MALSQTKLCYKRPFPVTSVSIYEHAQWCAPINALTIEVSLTLQSVNCTKRSERAKRAHSLYIIVRHCERTDITCHVPRQSADL